MKRIVKLAAPPTIKVDGKDVPAPGYVALGGGYYDVEDRVELAAGVNPIASGPGRYQSLPTADKPNVLRARVYRSKDATSLRAKANTAVGGNLPAGMPATGNTSGKPGAAAKALEVLAKAQQFEREGTAISLSVPMKDVATGDVVADDTLIPHLWYGESGSEPAPVPPLP